MATSQRTCPICAGPIVGRSDKKQCSPTCKREAKRQYDREYCRVNSARKTAAAIAWQRANPERKQAYDAEYRERTRERRLALKREGGRRRYAENIEVSRLVSRLAARKRQALLDSLRFRVTTHDVARIRNRQRNECFYCQTRLGNDAELDHVMPIARGGSHSLGNLAIACRACNRAKAHRTVMEWRVGKVVPRRVTDCPVIEGVDRG